MKNTPSLYDSYATLTKLYLLVGFNIVRKIFNFYCKQKLSNFSPGRKCTREAEMFISFLLEDVNRVIIKYVTNEMY